MKILLGLVALLMNPVIGLLGKPSNDSIVAPKGDIDIRESLVQEELCFEYNYEKHAGKLFAPVAHDDRDYLILEAPIDYGPLTDVTVIDDSYKYLESYYVIENTETRIRVGIKLKDFIQEDKFSFVAHVLGKYRGENVMSSRDVYVSRLNGSFSASTISQEQADMYIELNERANNRLTMQEFDRRNNERNSPFIDYSISTSGNAYYTFQLKETDSAPKPLKYVAVGCLNEQGNVLTTLQTDLNGRILKTSLPSGTDHLRLYSFSKRGTSNEIIRVEKTHDYADSYYYQDISLVQAGYGKTITINEEKDGIPSSFGRALLVLRPLIFGAKYVHDLSGNYPSFASAVYPYGFGSSYLPGTKILRLGDTANDYPDPVLHEYGHHVQHFFQFASNDFGGSHEAGQYALQEGKKLDGLKLTWGEAWPTVFGNMVGQYFSGEFNNYSGIDHFYDHEGSPIDLETCSYKYGEGYEWAAIAVLYDLYDPYNEQHDSFSLGHQGLWDLMMGAAQNGSLSTFDDFAHYFYSTHSFDEINFFGRLMSEYGFSPNPIVDGVGTFNESPLIHWRKTNAVYDNNGTLDTGKPAFYSNNYEITFYDGYRTPLFTIPTNNESIRLSTYDHAKWDTLLASYSSSYYIRVTSFQNNGDRNTGGYNSDLLLIKKPKLADLTESVSFSASSRIVFRPIYLGVEQSIAYTITSSRSGEVVFQTVGPEGTYLYLYNDSNSLLAQSSLRSGYQAHGYYYNGFLRYNLQANVPYKLKVKAMGGVSLTDNKLIVSRPLAFTTNWNPYNTAMSLEKVVSDNFYYGLWCERYKLSMFNYSPSTSGRHSIELSSDFDSYLYVIDTYTGTMYKDDDSAGNMDAKVTISDMVAGRTYLVAFTQYSPTEEIDNDNVEVHMWKH